MELCPAQIELKKSQVPLSFSYASIEGMKIHQLCLSHGFESPITSKSSIVLFRASLWSRIGKTHNIRYGDSQAKFRVILIYLSHCWCRGHNDTHPICVSGQSNSFASVRRCSHVLNVAVYAWDNVPLHSTSTQRHYATSLHTCTCAFRPSVVRTNSDCYDSHSHCWSYVGQWKFWTQDRTIIGWIEKGME